MLVLRSIRLRLTLWFLAVFALVILFVSGLLYVGLERVLTQNVDETLRRAAELSVAPPDEPAAADADLLSQLNLLSLAPARLLALDGSTLKRDALFPDGVPLTQGALNEAASGAARFESVRLGTNDYRIYTAPVRVNGERVAVVQVAQRMADELNTLSQVRALLAAVIPVSLFLAALGGWFLAGRALAPMEQVRRDVETIMGDTDLSRRVSQQLTEDEVGRLARTFDGLLERVQTAMGRERQFTADASHELRSPLTVLKGEISVALSRDRSASEYRESLIELEAAVDEMSVLVEDLLALSRASSNTALTHAPVDVGQLAAQVCERMQVIADDKGITLMPPSVAEPLVVQGDKLKLQRVLNNLVDNALRYTPAGGHVDVSEWREHSQACIAVRDTGIGIAPEHVPQVFERFYRADQARARESGGSGLGLAIAQAIARAHAGEITVQSTVGQGSVFTLCLPLE
jgi:heavy metal sensor kinase